MPILEWLAFVLDSTGDPKVLSRFSLTKCEVETSSGLCYYFKEFYLKGLVIDVMLTRAASMFLPSSENFCGVSKMARSVMASISSVVFRVTLSLLFCAFELVSLPAKVFFCVYSCDVMTKFF